MPVNSVNGLYDKNFPKWVLVRDCLGGEDDIKKKTTTYLPCPGGVSPKSDDYKRYLERTHFYMATARAADIFYGHILSNVPEQSGVPEEKPNEENLFLELLKDVDNEGTALDQFVSDLVWDTIQTGWSGLLVDYTHSDVTLTKADSEKLGHTSFIKRYTAESIINWRYDTVKNKRSLALVVLKEVYDDISADEYVPIPKERFRRLKLVNGVYMQSVWELIKNVAGKDEWVATTPEFAPEFNGKPLDFIPFFPCPAKEPENSPLLGIAYENIGHYQKTADFENDLHYTAIHTPYILGAKQPGHYVKDNETGEETFVPDPIYLGGSKILCFESEGEHTPQIGYLETNGSESPLNAIKACEERMTKMAGQAIANEKKGVEAAATARIHRAGENAVIGSFSLNIAEQVTPAVRLAAKWRGVPDSIVDKWSMSFDVQYASDLTEEEKMKMALPLVVEEVLSKKTLLIDYKGMTEQQADEELARIQKEKDGQPKATNPFTPKPVSAQQQEQQEQEPVEEDD
jgi:hypothetical protein